MATKTELAWTAGMIDADGCITLNVQKVGIYRKPMVTVDNTDMEILAELVRLFGGGLTKKKIYKEHHRQAWSWRLYGATKIRGILALIRPYMKNAMKRERASMIVDEYPKITRRNGFYTPELRAAKAEFEARFMALGEGRGKRATP